MEVAAHMVFVIVPGLVLAPFLWRWIASSSLTDQRPTAMTRATTPEEQREYEQVLRPKMQQVVKVMSWVMLTAGAALCLAAAFYLTLQ